jgi:hypothetical protein
MLAVLSISHRYRSNCAEHEHIWTFRRFTFFLFHLKAIAICSSFNPQQPRDSEAFGRSKLVSGIGEGGVMSWLDAHLFCRDHKVPKAVENTGREGGCRNGSVNLVCSLALFGFQTSAVQSDLTNSRKESWRIRKNFKAMNGRTGGEARSSSRSEGQFCAWWRRRQ